MPVAGTRFHFRNRGVMRARPRRMAGWFAGLLAGSALLANAQTAPRPEAIIKWRQSAYQVIGWNSGRIKTALAGNYDAREVASAANALAAVAGSGLESLFPANTTQGKGWRDTTARETIWSETPKFRALNEEFAHEAAELARVAGGSDAKAVQAQFQKVARTCKSCHDRYRQTD